MFVFRGFRGDFGGKAGPLRLSWLKDVCGEPRADGSGPYGVSGERGGKGWRPHRPAVFQKVIRGAGAVFREDWEAA